MPVHVSDVPSSTLTFDHSRLTSGDERFALRRITCRDVFGDRDRQSAAWTRVESSGSRQASPWDVGRCKLKVIHSWESV